MKPTPVANPQVRIGIFELDLQAGELHTNGLKIRLQDQPLKILTMLVDRSGEVLSREELRLKLWPADTFVDFEHGLNRAINKLRKSLGDDADKPRYVETLPRRGYRLIAPVVTVAPLSPPANRETAVQSRAVGTVQLQQEMPHRKRRIWPLAASMGLIVASGAFVYLLTRPLPPPKILAYTQLTHDGRMKEGIVTDGSRLYFNATFSGQSAIYQVSTSGGEVVPLSPTLPNATLADISPKGDELLVVTNLRTTGRAGALWTLPLVGGSPRRVGDAYARGFYLAASAAWSPDGTRIAYIGDWLYTSKSDGTDARKIPIPGDTSFRIRWSPDGRVLRFNIYDPKNGAAIWDVSPDGTNLHPLLPVSTKPDRIACCGNWTQDGRYFVFTDFSNLWALRERRQ
jgi:DNA-binding winged helix-turn-helix (wHTH) protein